MNEAKKRRMRAKRRAMRSIKRRITAIMLAPGKMPRITANDAAFLMELGEGAAIGFVIILLMHLIIPNIVGVIWVIIAGAVFGAILMLLGLSDYQDKLVEYELYGYKF